MVADGRFGFGRGDVLLDKHGQHRRQLVSLTERRWPGLLDEFTK